MTFLDRITRFYVLAAGLLVAGVVALVAFMTMIRPATAEYDAKVQAKVAQDTIAARRVTAQASLEKANAELATLKADYQVVKTARNPEIRMLADMDLTLFNYLWPELRKTTGPVMRTWFQEQGWDFRGIDSITNPGTSTIAADTNALSIPLGTIAMTIRDFPEVLQFLPKLKETPRITAMGNEITIRGPSPNLSIEFPLMLYLLTELPPAGVPRPGAPKQTQPATPSNAAPGPGAPAGPGRQPAGGPLGNNSAGGVGL